MCVCVCVWVTAVLHPVKATHNTRSQKRLETLPTGGYGIRAACTVHIQLLGTVSALDVSHVFGCVHTKPSAKSSPKKQVLT